MRNSVITPIATGVVLALVGATSEAATKTATFTVSATVSKNCIISAPNLNLGPGPFDGATDATGSSTISVNCTLGTPFTVDLSTGSSNSYAMRTLVNGTDTLNYNLYTSSAYTIVWGDGTGGSANAGATGQGMAAAQTQSLTVHGRLRASDNTHAFGAGTYNDTIIATINY
jgi:spore coat protein U-like protein